jgi:hypothetical protein
MKNKVAWLSVALAFLLAGCFNSKPEMEIRVVPRDIPPGGNASITLELTNPPGARQFKWEAQRGRLQPDAVDSTPARVYMAPESPGADVVTVKMMQDGKELLVKSAILQVGGNMAIPSPSASPQPSTNEQGSSAPVFEVQEPIVPSGWMGDGESGTKYIQVVPNSRENCHAGKTCWKWSYRAGPKGWAAVAWQFPENNWGNAQGRNMSGYSRVTFWARGLKGGERLIFKAGGNTPPQARFPASFEASTDTITLTSQWTQYSIPLAGKDLSNTASFFTWVATGRQNPDGVIFYLDGIFYEK